VSPSLQTLSQDEIPRGVRQQLVSAVESEPESVPGRVAVRLLHDIVRTAHQELFESVHLSLPPLEPTIDPSITQMFGSTGKNDVSEAHLPSELIVSDAELGSWWDPSIADILSPQIGQPAYPINSLYPSNESHPNNHAFLPLPGRFPPTRSKYLILLN
jgi:hypothetical protein